MFAIIFFAMWLVIVIVAYIALEVMAVRHNWPSTWQWASDLNDWLLSFKKKPKQNPVYVITVTKSDGTTENLRFDSIQDREDYLLRAAQRDWYEQTDEVRFK